MDCVHLGNVTCYALLELILLCLKSVCKVTACRHAFNTSINCLVSGILTITCASVPLAQTICLYSWHASWSHPREDACSHTTLGEVHSRWKQRQNDLTVCALQLVNCGLSEVTIKALEARGITALFPIQKHVYEPAAAGRLCFRSAHLCAFNKYAWKCVSTYI